MDLHDNDVAFGKGRGSLNLPGNQQFRRLCWSLRDEYSMAAPEQKRCVAVMVYSTILEMNPPGRFVQPSTDGEWEEVDETKALEKILQALREKKWHPQNPQSI